MKKLSKYYEDLVLNPEANGFCMLKPGFAQYADEFEKLLAANGWKVINKCVKKFTRDEIENFYACHKDKPFYNRLCDYMITDDCCCYSCYKNCKDPYKDMSEFKDKIRDQWGEDDMKNAMHSSDSKTNMKSETKLAFNKINESEEINEKLKISKKEKTKHTLFPKSKEELVNMIREEIKKNGNNCSLNHIDTSKISNMAELFVHSKFNGDISQWDVSNVYNMSYMFEYSEFDGDISEWNVSKVKNMHGMFKASKFNGDIYNWDVSNVENMGYMFIESIFNQDISVWNVSKVNDMDSMFKGSKFNEDISNWNVSKVNDMQFMFCDSDFNKPLDKWNVSNVKIMWGMFAGSQFNQDISKWNIIKCTQMDYMFKDSKFNKDISNWVIKPYCSAADMFYNCDIEEDFKPKRL